jgi:hypothetical protein
MSFAAVALVESPANRHHAPVISSEVPTAATTSLLTTLGLANNKLSTDAFALLAEVLIVNTTLTSVNLQRNSMGISGTRLLAQALKKNQTLGALDLGDNNIGPEGADLVAECLRNNASLHTINLSKNDLQAKGAGFIASALKTNSTVTCLNLDENGIADLGARFIAEAVWRNLTLFLLSMRDNDIGSDGRKLLAKARRGQSSREPSLLQHSTNSNGGVGLQQLDLDLNPSMMVYGSFIVNVHSTVQERDAARNKYTSFLTTVTCPCLAGIISWTLRKRFSDFDYFYGKLPPEDVVDIPFPVYSINSTF